MVLRGWREAIIAPTTEKVSSVTRLANTLASFVSPRNERSGTVELAARDNAIPPTSSATESTTSDQPSQAARRSILPTPRSWPFAPSVTTHPIYIVTVSQALRQALRNRPYSLGPDVFPRILQQGVNRVNGMPLANSAFPTRGCGRICFPDQSNLTRAQRRTHRVFLTFMVNVTQETGKSIRSDLTARIQVFAGLLALDAEISGRGSGAVNHMIRAVGINRRSRYRVLG